MTYNEIKDEYKKRHNASISTCYIADVKRKLGHSVRVAYNRINQKRIKKPCSDQVVFDRIKAIIEGRD